MNTDTPTPTPEAAPLEAQQPKAASGLGLGEIIQMECLGGNSSLLEVYNQSELGQIYIHNGKIIHAVFEDLTGVPAFSKLMNLPDGAYELTTFEPPRESTITTAWPALLNQALRTAAEEAAAKTAAETTGLPGETSVAGCRAEEKMFCSPKGEVFYASQCPDIPSRTVWMLAAVRQAEALGKILSLGDFDRMSIVSPGNRVVMRARTDNLAYVQVVTENKPA